jgi:hypothetical protein
LLLLLLLLTADCCARSAPKMGGKSSKKLSKEDMSFLMDNTNFTKQQIKAWYKGFMVSLEHYDAIRQRVTIPSAV